MQVTLDISDNLPLARIRQIILELETRLKMPIHLIDAKNAIIEKKPVPKFGSAKSLIKMWADFDEPLNDFASYSV